MTACRQGERLLKGSGTRPCPLGMCRETDPSGGSWGRGAHSCHDGISPHPLPVMLTSVVALFPCTPPAWIHLLALVLCVDCKLSGGRDCLFFCVLGAAPTQNMGVLAHEWGYQALEIIISEFVAYQRYFYGFCYHSNSQSLMSVSSQHHYPPGTVGELSHREIEQLTQGPT